MVRLELLEAKDIRNILGWNIGATSDFLFQWAGNGYKFPLTRDQVLTKLNHMHEAKEPRQIVFKIIDENNNRMIGTVELSDIDRRNKQAYVSRFLIGEESNRNRGYGTAALKMVMVYACGQLGLNTLFLRVFDFNKNAIQCYKKAGFKIREVIHRIRETNHTVWNVYVMHILLDEKIPG